MSSASVCCPSERMWELRPFSSHEWAVCLSCLGAWIPVEKEDVSAVWGLLVQALLSVQLWTGCAYYWFFSWRFKRKKIFFLFFFFCWIISPIFQSLKSQCLTTHVHGLENLLFLGWQHAPRLTYRFSAIPIKIKSQLLFAEIRSLILNSYGNAKGPRMVKAVLKKKNKVGGLSFSGFRTYHKAVVVRMVWHWREDGHINHWNPHIYCQWIFSKGVKTVQREGLPWWLRWSRICLPCRRPGFNPWVGNILWRREWQPTAVLLPGEFHGQRNLVGYSTWGHRRVRHDWATFTFLRGKSRLFSRWRWDRRARA